MLVKIRDRAELKYNEVCSCAAVPGALSSEPAYTGLPPGATIVTRPAGAAADRNQAVSGMNTEYICRREYWSNSLKRSWCNKNPRDPKGSLDFARDFACGLKRPQDGSTSTTRPSSIELQPLSRRFAQEDRGWECWRGWETAVLHEHRGKAHRQECLLPQEIRRTCQAEGRRFFCCGGKKWW
jgi:hypothetical protein